MTSTRRMLGAAVAAGALVIPLLAGAAHATGARPSAAPAPAHPWRHGVVPLRPGAQHHGFNASAQAASGGNLTYHGGQNGNGVVTGSPKVYVVFWGSQWGTQSTNGNGDVTLSGDPDAIAQDLQAFFKGLGTGNELWSGVMTQYCQGVASGTQTCPSSAVHAGYPTGGALGGVWVDESSPVPASATSSQLGQEALAAASHFGFGSTSAALHSQFVIVSPTGTHPDDFNAGGGFCAWHSSAYSGSTGIAYTNLPYIPNASGCGANFVNSGAAGVDDGVTITAGHEYAETITDQFPNNGWLDSQGGENGDKCAWISSGQGAAQDITLATGSFAVQSTWANDFNAGAGGCEISHPIVGGIPANTVTVTSPGAQSGTVGTAISPLQVHASDSTGQSLTYTATGLPAGLSISSSGSVTGTPTAAGTSSVTVTAKDATGATGSTTFSWTVHTGGANTVTVTSPGAQSGTVGTAISPLQVHASDSATGQSLTYTATGLPAGLSISSSGSVTGTPTSAGTSSVTVTAKDATGATGSTTFSWTVNGSGGGGGGTLTSGATYAIGRTGTTQVIDDPNLSTKAGTQQIVYTVNGGANQQWTATANPDGSYTFKNVASGMCMDNAGSSTAAGSRIIQWYCTGSPNQAWKLTASASRTSLVNEASGLAVTPSGTSDGSTLTQQAGSQAWTFTKAASGTGGGGGGSLTSGGVYDIGRTGTTQVIDDPNLSTKAATQLIVYTVNGGSNQQWTATANPDGSYTFKNVASGMCMDDTASSRAAGSRIIQWYCTGSPNQAWKLTASGSGFALVNEASGLAVTPGGTSDGSTLTQQAGSPAWTFTKAG